MLDKTCVQTEIICYTVKVKHLDSFHFQVCDLNPSVTKGIGTHIGYQGGRGGGRADPQVSHDSLDLEA